MKETFRVSIVNTKTQSRTDFESTASTLSELKSELYERGVDYSGMTFMEGSTKVELKDDSSILPTNVPVKRNGVATGETTNDLVFFLTTPNKNIKSGAMSRAEAYAFMKEHPEVAANFKSANNGKNYTNATTDAISAFIEVAMKPKTVKKTKKVTKVEEVVETSEPVVSSAQSTSSCQNIFDNILGYASELKNVGVLTDAHYKGFEAILNGEEAPKVEHSYSDSDIDNMYGDWMK